MNTELPLRAATADPAFGDRVMHKVVLRLVPFIIILYMVNYIDRVNLGFAALTMNPDLGITPVMFGLVSGVFFIGYVIFEYPSNRMLERLGARVWISRILLSWGVVVVLLSLAASAFDVGVLRLLLGIAEAGFYPGIVFYLSLWLRNRELARCMSYLYAAQIIAIIIGAPLSTIILDNVSWLGIAGWRWLFVLEGIPAILLCFVTWKYLTDRPEQAAWLEPTERAWLVATIRAEREVDGVPVRRTPRDFFSRLWFNRLWIAFFFEMACGYAIVFFLPQIVYAFRFDTGHTATGIITALPYAGALACMLLWARHSDITGERMYHLLVPWTCAGIGFFLTAVTTGPVLSLLALSLATIGMYSGIPVFWAVVTERMRSLDGSGGIALVNALGTTGGFVGPFVMGFVIAAQGGAAEGPVLTLFGVFMILAVLLLAWDFTDWRKNGCHGH
ncbi:MFS transporter [Methanoregula sp.]|uniref:MFS transporter n=1 Tax=Methanoregula sp. TaxID=2052170 RepID=UPI002D1C2940|nr:MFS transporter [Methanoregula sp.]HVP97605.1 MFS transporter [Methanoregula sp.]